MNLSISTVVIGIGSTASFFILAFISGVASRCLLGKLGPGRFARDRVIRLLPTLMISCS